MSGLPLLRCGLFTAACLLSMTCKPALGQFLDPNDLAVAKAMADYDRQLDVFIAIVEKEDTFESLVQGLNEPSRGHVPIPFATAPNPIAETAKFDICLANRRVARLYEMLKGRPDPGRDCSDIFEDKLAILHRGFTQRFDALKRGTVAFQKRHPDVDLDDEMMDSKQAMEIGNEIWKLGPPPAEKFNHETAACAVSAAIFLSAEFCSVEEVIRQFDAWRKVSGELEEHCHSPFKLVAGRMESLRVITRHCWLPQPTFELSVLASMLKRRFTLEPGGTWAGDEQAMQAIWAANGRMRLFDEQGRIPTWAVYNRVRFFSWNSRSTPFNVSSLPATGPFNPDECFGEFLSFKNAEFPGNDEVRQRLLDDLHKRLLLAEAEEAGKSIELIPKAPSPAKP